MAHVTMYQQYVYQKFKVRFCSGGCQGQSPRGPPDPVDRSSAPCCNRRVAFPMPPSLNQRLLVLSLLIIGTLALSGKAAASEPYLSSLRDPAEETALVPSEPSEMMASGTYRAIEVELGLIPPLEKQEPSEDSSVTQGPVAPPGDPGDTFGGGSLTVSLPPLASPEAPSSAVLVSVGRRRLPPYEIDDRPEGRLFVDRYQTGHRRAVG